MSRRKRPEKHVNYERWLVSYADFITLLFAFFVVLYSSSQVDKRKMGKLALSIQVAFQQMGVFDTSNTLIPLNDSEAIPFSQVQVVENAERTSDSTRFVQPMKGKLPARRGTQSAQGRSDRQPARNRILRKRLCHSPPIFQGRHRPPRCGP
jgi:flagellar motor protein MotB